MTKRTGQINPKEVSITLKTVLGSVTLEGFYEGTFINIVYDANNYNYLVGADGEAARVNTNNLSVLITPTLLQTSLVNDTLSIIANADRKTGLGAFGLLLRDNWGKTAGAAPVAWFEKFPDQPFDGGANATPQSRAWPIRAPHYEGTVGSSIEVVSA